jgi:hypothetical protein
VALQTGFFLLRITQPLPGGYLVGFLGSKGFKGPGVSGLCPYLPLIAGLGFMTGFAFGRPDDFRVSEYITVKKWKKTVLLKKHKI